MALRAYFSENDGSVGSKISKFAKLHRTTAEDLWKFIKRSFEGLGLRTNQIRAWVADGAKVNGVQEEQDEGENVWTYLNQESGLPFVLRFW